MSLVYHVMQDGADFYVFSDMEAERLLLTRTAPFPVRDGDVVMAQEARRWFLQIVNQKTRNTMKWIS